MPSLESLPPELWVAVIGHSDSPCDLYALIRACPFALRVLVRNRRQIISKYIRDLEHLLKGQIPVSALLTTRLHHDKLSWTTSMTNNEVEDRVRRLVTVHRQRVSTQSQFQLPIQLRAFCTLWTTIIQAIDTTSIYSSEAWEEIGAIVSSPGPLAGTAEDTLELTAVERHTFQEAVFHYDGYCQAFFHDEEILFWKRYDIRRSFLMPVLYGPGRCMKKQQFYSIAYYIYNQHWLMMDTVSQHLSPSTNWPSRVCLEESNENIDARIRNSYINWLLAAENPRDGGLHKQHQYLSYLTSQGVSLLLKLRSMDIGNLTEFTLSTYSRICKSTRPACHLTDLGGRKQGVVEGGHWMPWILCNEVHFSGLSFWKEAYHFWDNPRRKWISEHI